MSKKKKKGERKPAPVETGHDGRCRERAAGNSPREPKAPDGVSGDWN